jgi:RHS repeat-associated protein
LWKEVGGQRTYFVYANEGLVGEYNNSGTEIKSYGYIPNSTSTTNLLFQKINNDYYWYLNDDNGTPQKIVATNGQVVWSGTYDSFGNCTVGINLIENNIRYPGQYFDAETGLHYNLHRYYDPKIGRYLNSDPLEDGLNFYTYCYNNPINLVDPSGLCAAKNAWNDLKAQQAFYVNYVVGVQYVYWLADLIGGHNNIAGDAIASLLYAGANTVEGICNTVPSFIGQVGDFINDPSMSTIPILGPLGTEIGESYAEAVDNPNYATISKAIGMTAMGVDAALGGAAAARSAGLTGYNEVPIEMPVEKPMESAGPYVPDRILPTDEYGVPVPDVDVPHTQLGLSKPKYGSEPQAREWDYGSNGNLQPKRDIDFTDHGKPDMHPDVPHQHVLTPNNPKIAPKGGYQRGNGEPL